MTTYYKMLMFSNYSIWKLNCFLEIKEVLEYYCIIEGYFSI